MIIFLSIILVAFAPCIFWLWMIYRRDKYMPEPKSLIIKTFLMGVGIAIPVAIVESFIYPSSLQEPTFLSLAYTAFIVAGVTEELGKFLVVRLGVYKSRFFEEPADGLIYAAAAALGFASLENLIYLIDYGWQVILIRGIFSNLAHVLFSVLWGYPLVMYKIGKLKNKGFVWLGFIGSVLAHGIFDFLLFTQNSYSWLVIVFFLAMVIGFILLYRHANRTSVYARKNEL